MLDVACGTGANFAALLRRVGPEGEVVGVDLSPDMLAVAARRVQAGGWSNVTLAGGVIEDAQLPPDLAAALFSLTHDVLQSERAVENVVGHLRPEAAVAAFGVKEARCWAAPLNPIVKRIAAQYVTTFDGFDRPWRLLERQLGDDLYVEDVLAGCAYILSGHVRSEAVRD